MTARSEAILKARALLDQKPVYLDTETTGTGEKDNIVEIAILDPNGHPLVDTLVKPVGPISAEALAVHGISEAMVREAPRWREVWEETEPILNGQLVGIYNADFDLRMMRQSHASNWMQWVLPEGMRVFCLMKLYSQYYGKWNPKYGNYYWQSLDAARRQCGIALPNSHRARDDSLLARAILDHMAGKNP